MKNPLSALPPLVALMLASAPAAALPTVACHVSYGGETQTLRAVPTETPYAAPTVAIGSYFRFRIVFEHPRRALPAVKIYTYADREQGPTPIHVAHYPYPAHTPVSSRRFGFTGEQTVYEPLRDGELIYWCEIARGRR